MPARHMREYFADNWQAIFAHNGFRTFDDFWQREIEWFEQPNFRRGGWSGVGRCELKTPTGGTVAVFVKRQENHVTRTWRHPIRGSATLEREFANLLEFERLRLPAPALLYFASHQVEGKLRAVLITEELGGFRSLEARAGEWSCNGRPAIQVRTNWIKAMAEVISRMHAHRFQHNCLYAKHLFLRAGVGEPIEIRIIDLEKARRRCLRNRAVYRDLDTLNRHAPGWSRTDRLRFLKAYLGSNDVKTIRPRWRKLARMAQEKSG